MRTFTRRIFTSALLVTLPLFSSAFAQENFPSRPLKIVVPFPPGGGSDMVARIIANGMREQLNQPVLIENKAGAGTVIGTEFVAKSPADGYTMLWMATPFAINATLLETLPYDTLKDLTPVVDLVEMPLVMIVHPSSPAKNVQDFIKLAKEQPGKLAYGSSGNGGSPHLALEIFQSATGTSLTHVPYRGSAPSVQDLIAGQTDVVMDTTILVAPHVKAGKARALAQSGSSRSSYLPDTPTMQEQGVNGYEVTSWMSLAVPAGTPQDVINKLNQAARAVVESSSVREQLNKQGLEVIASTPEDSERRLREEIEKWGKAIQTSGAKAD